MEPSSHVSLGSPYQPITSTTIPFEEIKHYLENKSRIDVLSLVLSAAFGYRGMIDGQESYSAWLQEHQSNGVFLTSKSIAGNRLADEKSKVTEELSNALGEIKALKENMAFLKNDPALAKDAKKMETQIKINKSKISSLQAIIEELEIHKQLLDQIQISSGPNLNTCTIKGPLNWQQTLAQLEKSVSENQISLKREI